MVWEALSGRLELFEAIEHLCCPAAGMVTAATAPSWLAPRNLRLGLSHCSWRETEVFATEQFSKYTTWHQLHHLTNTQRRELVPSLAGPWGTNHAVAGTSQPGAAPSLGFSSHLAYSSFYCSTLKLDSYFRAAAILANLYNCIKYK